MCCCFFFTTFIHWRHVFFFVFFLSICNLTCTGRWQNNSDRSSLTTVLSEKWQIQIYNLVRRERVSNPRSSGLEAFFLMLANLPFTSSLLLCYSYAMDLLSNAQQYLTYVVVVSFIGEDNWRKPYICWKYWTHTSVIEITPNVHQGRWSHTLYLWERH